MKQAGLILFVIAIISSMSACSINNNTERFEMAETPVESPLGDQETVPFKNITGDEESNEKFSYLKQLPVEKQVAFTRFKEERNLHDLYNFTPEDMVLAYLYCLSIGDPDLIYAITYNGGQLPDQDEFREDYFEYVMNYDSETAVHYRYYDSIKVDENTAEENKVTVRITVGVGSTTHSLALGLQKEDQVWKLDIYHLIKEYKNKASKNKP